MATTSDDVAFRVLVKAARKAAKRFCERHHNLDYDAAESVALEAAMEAKARWEAKRASLPQFGSLVVASRLGTALKRGRLYGDAAARAFDAVPLDDLGDGCESEPSYSDAAVGESIDDVLAALRLSEDDERLVRERLDGDRSVTVRADGLTASDVLTRLRRIKRRIEEVLLNGGDQC